MGGTQHASGRSRNRDFEDRRTEENSRTRMAREESLKPREAERFDSSQSHPPCYEHPSTEGRVCDRKSKIAKINRPARRLPTGILSHACSIVGYRTYPPLFLS